VFVRLQANCTILSLSVGRLIRVCILVGRLIQGKRRYRKEDPVLSEKRRFLVQVSLAFGSNV
jgi:hypothetical protein